MAAGAAPNAPLPLRDRVRNVGRERGRLNFGRGKSFTENGVRVFGPDSAGAGSEKLAWANGPTEANPGPRPTL